MTAQGSNRKTVFALAGALGLALVAVAFLLGRESARLSEAPQAEAEAEVRLPQPPILEPAAKEETSQRWPEWDEPTNRGAPEAPAHDSAPVMAERIERQATGTVLLSNRGNDPDSPDPSANSPADDVEARVSAYFREIDSIRSGQAAVDPNLFAMGLIKGALAGSTSGFDQLIADTKRLEQETRRVTPPESCKRYHDASLEALAEGRELLEDLKTAIARQDIQRLTTMAQQAGALQQKAEAMKQMRAQIYASVRR